MASFLEALARGAEFRAFSGLASPAGWLVDSLAGRPVFGGKRVSVQSALGLTAVYAATTMISETIGGLPFKVYRRVDENPVEASQHRSWRMIHDKPNSFVPAQRFWATVANHLLWYGNSFIPYSRDDLGLVDELWLEDPDGMNVSWDGNEKRFWRDTPTGRKKWSSEEMLHIMGPSRDGLIGMSPIQECRDAYSTAIAREEFEGSFYQRGAVLSGWIEYPGQLSEGANTNLSRSFAQRYQGSGRAGGTPILEEGAQFHTVQSPLRDLQFVESKQLSRTDIATIYKIPPAFLGGTTGDSLTYSTIESNKIHFADFAVAPVAMSIAKAVSASPAIFPQQNAFYAEFVFEGLLRADAKTRGEFYKLLYDMNSLTNDEIRSKENMGPASEAVGEFKSDTSPPAPEPENGNGQVESPGDLIARLARENTPD